MFGLKYRYPISVNKWITEMKIVLVGLKTAFNKNYYKIL